MSRFTEVMQSNPPRLIMRFSRGDNGEEQYTWGLAGSIPIMSLIGAVAAVQEALISVESDLYETCDEIAIVICYHATENRFSWYIHNDIPLVSLVGMLELAKQTLVSGQMIQMAQQQQRASLVDPSGHPINSNRI